MDREKPSSEPPADHLSVIDRTLDAMNQQRRRYALYLLQLEESMAIETMANRILEMESDTKTGGRFDEDPHSVAMTLQHSHLPRLDQLGFIDYDQRSGDIRLRDPPKEFCEIVEVVKDLEEYPTEDVNQDPR